MFWLEQAFPRTSCVWVDDFTDFISRTGGTNGSDVGFGAIIVLNGAAVPTPDILLLNDQLRSFRWVLLVVQGDEGSGFHLEWLEHPNISIWVIDSKPGKHDKFNRMPTGALQLQFKTRPKSIDWFFSGSVRDTNWDKDTRGLRGEGKYYNTHLGYEEYVEYLASSKIVICRPAWVGPETCRVYDALESNSIPIVGYLPAMAQCYQCKEYEEHPHPHAWWRDVGFDWPNYWPYVLGEQPPFPVIQSSNGLQDIVRQTLHEWPESGNRVHSWWIDYKARFVDRLREDVRRMQS